MRVLVKDVVLVDGALLPHGFRLEWTDNDQHGYPRRFDSVRTSCGVVPLTVRGFIDREPVP